MGIHDLLPNLPGGARYEYCHSFYGLGMKGKVVPIDAAIAHCGNLLQGMHGTMIGVITHLPWLNGPKCSYIGAQAVAGNYKSIATTATETMTKRHNNNNRNSDSCNK